MLMMRSLPFNSAVSPQRTWRWSGKHTRGKPASAPSNWRWWSPSIQRMTSVHARAPERWMEVNKRGEVNMIPECGWTKHSRCSAVEIEDIGTSHTTVSQRADQVREVTRHQTTQKDDRIRQKIVWTEFHVKSEITITIPNHQWMPISIRRAKIHCYRATMASDNQCDGEVVDGATKVHSGR